MGEKVKMGACTPVTDYQNALRMHVIRVTDFDSDSLFFPGICVLRKSILRHLVKPFLEYAIHNQRDRRNLTDADILRVVQIVDKRKQRGGDHRISKSSNEPIDISREETAQAIGISATKVQQTRTILDHADEQTKE